MIAIRRKELRGPTRSSGDVEQEQPTRRSWRLWRPGLAECEELDTDFPADDMITGVDCEELPVPGDCAHGKRPIRGRELPKVVEPTRKGLDLQQYRPPGIVPGPQVPRPPVPWNWPTKRRAGAEGWEPLEHTRQAARYRPGMGRPRSSPWISHVPSLARARYRPGSFWPWPTGNWARRRGPQVV